MKLSKIKYGGDSIGRDIRVEVEVLGKFLRVDKRIKAGTTVEINQEAGRFETDRGSFQTDVLITVIERDLLFNDVGSAKGSVKINTAIIKPQQFVFKIQVKESCSILSRLFWGKRTAIFEVTLEAQIGEIERCTPDTEDGWLVAQTGQGERVSLPAYITAHPKSIKNGREYFIPSEGTYRGELLSVPLKDDNSSYLISNIKHESMVSAKYSISEKVFTLNGKKYKAIDYPEAPWEKGIYDIGIPDFPHGSNDTYTEAIRQKVWFPIDFENARYLHVGARSAGCMTIIETTRWMEIYNALIKARKGDFKNIGIVKIID
ncbi:MAG: hypothetical protein WAW67_03875 [Candidatus Omnitrophota bacterium]